MTKSFLQGELFHRRHLNNIRRVLQYNTFNNIGIFREGVRNNEVIQYSTSPLGADSS